MPVITAEALMAQAAALNKGGPASAPLATNGKPRPRQQQTQKHNPNPTTAGSSGAAKARMSYYIPGPQPIQKRPIKPLPLRTTATTASGSTAADETQGRTFTDFDLVPGVLNTGGGDWKMDVMTFRPANKDHKIDLRDFHEPIQLNRKNPKSMIYAEPDPDKTKDAPLVPMKGPDGKPVYHNGEMVMVGPDGQTAISAAKARSKVTNDKGKGKEKPAADGASDKPGKKKPSKKKIKQTFLAPETVRQKRKEEYLPWFMQDAEAGQEWVGTMNSMNDDGIYAIFKIDSNTGKFEFVPCHRYYDFRPKKQIISSVRADDAAERFAAGRKVNLAAAFAARNGGQITENTRAFQAKIEKQELEDMKPLLRRPKEEDDLFGDSKREAEGDVDEMDYEENMADDEEGDRHEEMAEDEEEKRAQERLKREWIAANKAGASAMDDSEDDLDLSGVPNLNEDGKKVKKSLIKNEGYEESSSSDEDDEYSKKYGVKKEPQDQDTIMTVATGVQQQEHKPRKPVPSPTPAIDVKPATKPTPARPSLPTTTSAPAKTPSSTRPIAPSTSNTPKTTSRAASPAAAASGSAIVAMRATSPIPKRPAPPSARATSPLAGNRTPLAVSGTGTPRAISPPATPISQANAATANAKKRKDPPAAVPPPSATGSATPDMKRPKVDKEKVDIPTAADVVEFIKSRGGSVTAKELATRFKTKDSATVKQVLIGLVKQVAKMDNGKVVLPPS